MSVLSKLLKPFVRYHCKNIWLDKQTNGTALKHNASANTAGLQRHEKRTSERQAGCVHFHHTVILLSHGSIMLVCKTSRRLIVNLCILCSKLTLLTSRWDRSFFFIQGGNLMNQLKDEVSSVHNFGWTAYCDIIVCCQLLSVEIILLTWHLVMYWGKM